MKSITLIFFGLILALHCANGDVFDQAKKNIAIVKKNIKDTVSRINKEIDEGIGDYQKHLTTSKNSALNLSKIKIDTEVSLIKKAGEKNRDCLKKYKNEINGVQLKCNKEITSCFDKVALELEDIKTEIIPTVDSIKALEMDIDRGTINCIGAITPIDYSVCVTKVLAQVNISLKASSAQVQAVSLQMKKKAEFLKNSATPCSNSVVSTIVSRLQVIRDDVKLCAPN